MRTAVADTSLQSSKLNAKVQAEINCAVHDLLVTTRFRPILHQLDVVFLKG